MTWTDRQAPVNHNMLARDEPRFLAGQEQANFRYFRGRAFPSNWLANRGSCLSTPAKRCRMWGLMMSGVPNFASVFGYINASWTLKANFICAYVCPLLNFMEKRGARQVVPRRNGEPATTSSSSTSHPATFSAGWRLVQSRDRDSLGAFIRTISVMSSAWAGSRFDNGVFEFPSPVVTQVS